MNDIFEFTRFGLLLKKTILERALQLIGLTGLVLIATLLIYAYSLWSLGWPKAQGVTFLTSFVLGGAFLSSVVFSYFSTNASGAAYLTLPASAFEKWLSGVLMLGVVFVSIFFIFFRLIDIGFIAAYHNGLDKNNPHYIDMFNEAKVFSFQSDLVKQSTAFFVNFSGAMMVGALYFNKVSVVKTVLVYCGIWAVIFFFNLAVANAIFKDVDMAFPFETIFIKIGNDDGTLELPLFYQKIVDAGIQIIIPAILWITAFIRLREKEI